MQITLVLNYKSLKEIDEARYKPRHYILTPLGTMGDVNPFLWIGNILRNRGHKVTLILATTFEKPTGTHSLDVKYSSPDDQKEVKAVLKNPQLWHPWHGVRILFAFAGAWTEQIFRLIQECQRSDMENVILAPGTAFGARLAREKLGLPLGTIHLQPCAIPSVYAPPAMRHGFQWMAGWYWIWRRFFSFMPTPLDFYAHPGIRRACRTQQVRPPKNILNQWWHSPDGILCLFPNWFAQPQSDWPASWVQTGFPLYDRDRQNESSQVPDGLRKFLESGQPPILFTLGTAMKHPGRFFETAARVCRLLKCRGLFFSNSTVPLSELPPANIFFCENYVPFSWLFSRIRAVVHHGGIGTLSQGLVAGIPQLLMPLGFDQPDNAARLVRLGVARILSPSGFTVENVAQELNDLLTSTPIRMACEAFARQLSSEDPTISTLTFLENLSLHQVARSPGRPNYNNKL